MSDFTDEIDSESLRIRLDGRHEDRKDIINRARELLAEHSGQKALVFADWIRQGKEIA